MLLYKEARKLLKSNEVQLKKQRSDMKDFSLAKTRRFMPQENYD